MYMADWIKALHKHVDPSYSMDLFVSKVVSEILLLFLVLYIPKGYTFGTKIKILLILPVQLLTK